MTDREAFFTVYHRSLPRQGPGHLESTARALFSIPTLVARPQVLDLACGAGAQTLDLARLLPDATITALDAHAPFLDELGLRAGAEGVADRIQIVEGDLAQPPDGPHDLIWCEGAAYFLGFERALEQWAPLLAPGGSIALTEPVWLSTDAPPRVRACWGAYPDLQPLSVRRAQVAAAGLALHADFVLPDRDWWELYYSPLEARVAALRAGAPPELSAVLDAAQEEIEVRRGWAGCYGYAFFVIGLPEEPR